MHLVPADRADRHTIDGHRVCEAIEGNGETAAVQAWAQRFALLADPGRLSLLLALRAAPDLCVSDLATATGMNDPATSQALRLLRVAGVVTAHKDGRIIRYRITDEHTLALLPTATP